MHGSGLLVKRILDTLNSHAGLDSCVDRPSSDCGNRKDCNRINNLSATMGNREERLLLGLFVSVVVVVVIVINRLVLLPRASGLTVALVFVVLFCGHMCIMG